MEVKSCEVRFGIFALAEDSFLEKAVPYLAEVSHLGLLDVIEACPEPSHQFLSQRKSGRL
jgi:hypothetical protein